MDFFQLFGSLTELNTTASVGRVFEKNHSIDSGCMNQNALVFFQKFINEINCHLIYLPPVAYRDSTLSFINDISNEMINIYDPKHLNCFRLSPEHVQQLLTSNFKSNFNISNTAQEESHSIKYESKFRDSMVLLVHRSTSLVLGRLIFNIHKRCPTTNNTHLKLHQLQSNRANINFDLIRIDSIKGFAPDDESDRVKSLKIVLKQLFPIGSILMQAFLFFIKKNIVMHNRFILIQAFLFSIKNNIKIHDTKQCTASISGTLENAALHFYTPLFDMLKTHVPINCEIEFENSDTTYPYESWRLVRDTQNNKLFEVNFLVQMKPAYRAVNFPECALLKKLIEKTTKTNDLNALTFQRFVEIIQNKNYEWLIDSVLSILDQWKTHQTNQSILLDLKNNSSLISLTKPSKTEIDELFNAPLHNPKCVLSESKKPMCSDDLQPARTGLFFKPDLKRSPNHRASDKNPKLHKKIHK